MTVSNRAGRLARSRPMETLTRVGFVGYGLLHLAVAWLAVQLVVGHQPGETDQSGALATLAAQPFGRFLLIVIVVGLAAMAVWQLLMVVIGQGAERLVSVGRVLAYGVLAWTALRVVLGTPTSSAQQQQQATAGVLAHPAGKALVIVAGLGVLAIGIGMMVYGAKRMFERKLMTARMSAPVRKAARRSGQIGYVAKGVAFGIVGLLLADAGLTSDPGKSRGLDAALHTLVQQPFGRLLLSAVAIGFAAAGVYCFVQARYRKVTQ